MVDTGRGEVIGKVAIGAGGPAGPAVVGISELSVRAEGDASVVVFLSEESPLRWTLRNAGLSSVFRKLS